MHNNRPNQMLRDAGIQKDPYVRRDGSFAPVKMNDADMSQCAAAEQCAQCGTPLTDAADGWRNLCAVCAAEKRDF